MKIKNSLGIPAVLFSVFVWGISFVSTKIVLNDLPPVTIAFLRQFIALVPLLILMGIKKESFHIKKHEFLSFILATLFGIVLYFVFENKGLTMTSASNASMLVAAIPIFAFVAESITKRAKMEPASLFCIIASILGVYFVVFEGSMPDLTSKAFWGNLLVLGAMISWIAFTFLSKKLGETYSSLKMTTLQTLMSIPLFMPFVVSEIGAWKIPSTLSMLNLVFLGFFCSALAYVFYLYGLQALGPVLPSALLNLIPVVTILAGSIFLSEGLSLHQIIGAILIIGSLSFLSFMKIRSQGTVLLTPPEGVKRTVP